MRLWKILHWLFGWQYVHMENSCDEVICRVRTSLMGRRFVRYGPFYVWLDDDGSGWTITPLTHDADPQP